MNQDEWITLRTFHSRNDALLLRSLLDSEGIKCLIPEEHTSSIQPWTTAFHVRVLVQKRDLERAEELAQISENPPEEP